MILAIFLICLVSLTPLPTLPLVIYYYSKFGFSKKPTEGISIGDGLDNERLLGLDINKSFLEEAVEPP